MNPVLRKDLLGLLRLKRVAAIQVFFVFVLAMLVLVTWPQQGVVSLASRGQDNLLLGLIIGQLVLLMLFVPGIAAVSLTEEKEQNTLEMLYASRLSAAQIIFGKIGSAVAYPLLLLVTGLPFVGLLYYRGDVDLMGLAWAYLILVVTAVFLAAVSLAISAVSRQTSTALVFAYVLALVLCGGVLVPAAIMLESQQGLNAMVLHYSRSVSPVAAALSLLRPNLNDVGGEIHQLPPAWQVFVPFALAAIAGSFVLLVVRLRKPPNRPEALGGGGHDQAQRSLARKLMYLIDDKKIRKPFGSVNPVLGKESRTSPLRSGRWMIRIFYGSLFLSLGLALMSLYGGTEHGDLLNYVARVLVVLQIGVIALVDPSLTAPAVSTELETGTWEVLRLTPLSGNKIFWGKFLPAFLPALLPILALVPAYGAVCYINFAYIQLILLLIPLLVMAVALCCVVGLLCSTLFDSTARATVVSYVVIAAWFILPMFAWWAAGTQIDQRLGEILSLPSPIVVAQVLLTPDAPDIRRVWSEHLIVMGAACVLLLIVARVRLTHLLRRG